MVLELIQIVISAKSFSHGTTSNIIFIIHYSFLIFIIKGKFHDQKQRLQHKYCYSPLFFLFFFSFYIYGGEGERGRRGWNHKWGNTNRWAITWTPFSFQILIPLKIEKFQLKYEAKENIIRHFKYLVSPNEAHIYKYIYKNGLGTLVLSKIQYTIIKP